MNASDRSALDQIEAAEEKEEIIEKRAAEKISGSHIEELEKWATAEEWNAIVAAATRWAESEIEDEIRDARAEEAYRRREDYED